MEGDLEGRVREYVGRDGNGNDGIGCKGVRPME